MSGRNEREWWERSLPDVERELRAFLARRLPALHARHDDLINETLMDLSQRVRAREGLPAAWFERWPGRVSDEDRAHFAKLAMTILRRRIADGFRGVAKRWAERAGDEVLETRTADTPDLARAAHAKRVWQACVAMLETVSESDRELLLAAGGAIARGDRDPREEDVPLSPRDRQRLKRLRDRLATALRERFGDDVTTLLRDDD